MRILLLLYLAVSTHADCNFRKLDKLLGLAEDPILNNITDSWRTPEFIDGLRRMNETCLTDEKHYQFMGFKKFLSPKDRSFNSGLLLGGAEFIQLTETRKALGFGPPIWRKKKKWWNRANEEKLKTMTIKEYYDEKEFYSLYGDDEIFSQRKINSSSALLDRRFPFIRNAFKRMSEAIRCANGGVVDRK
uniref:Uncharacterized protein n=1 Tax=Caenorhabditis tropicalis TaxID=1561998 RepID=A0A1I7ULT5_9PELO